jgi:serine-type D-Ala-D-Ala carboxypeptidase (penicillin-binding protein 5/6)
MGKPTYYSKTHGVQKTQRLRQVLFVVFSLSILVFGVYPELFGSTNENIIEQNSVVNQQDASAGGLEASSMITENMPWPGYGSSAYAVPKAQLFAVSEDTAQSVPIASLTKVITALAVLDKHPLEPGEQGPMITLTEEDVQLYHAYARKGGMVVPVEAGAQISLYQALQASMMMSANNMTDTLVISVFGSMDNYLAYANTMLRDMDLHETAVADATGFSPFSVSTAKNMTILGHEYMQNPVLRKITMQEEAVIPVAGLIKNHNSFANEDGTVGIKIGYTDEARRTYMAADVDYDDGSIDGISIAVVLGAEDFRSAAKDARAILKAGNSNSSNGNRNSNSNNNGNNSSNGIGNQHRANPNRP